MHSNMMSPLCIQSEDIVSNYCYDFHMTTQSFALLITLLKMKALSFVLQLHACTMPTN